MTENTMKRPLKIAYIINGQLRVKNLAHAQALNKQFEGGDVFLITYPEYANTAKHLTHKELMICNPPKLRQDGLYQYWTLQETLKVYKEKLKEYDVIFRYRTDLELRRLPNGNLTEYLQTLFQNDTSNNNRGDFYARSDWIFSCKTQLFFDIFENVYDNILNNYIDRERIYLPINFENLRLTLMNGIHHIRWHWVNYPSKYFSVANLSGAGLLKILTDNKEQLSRENFDSNTPTITHPVSLKQRQSRPLSTEKFIILFVLRMSPIKQFTFDMEMPKPLERNRWKL